MTLYNCKSEIDGLGDFWHRITKFDDDMNVEASYKVTLAGCDCPAGKRPTCRHRKMLPNFIRARAVNTAMFYDFDRDLFIGDDITDEPEIVLTSASDEPHSETVNAAEFDSAGSGSSPDVAAKPEIALTSPALARIPGLDRRF